MDNRILNTPVKQTYPSLFIMETWIKTLEGRRKLGQAALYSLSKLLQRKKAGQQVDAQELLEDCKRLQQVSQDFSDPPGTLDNLDGKGGPGLPEVIRTLEQLL